MTGVQLNRESIVSAATTILDTYGLGDMTMRRVASHLSVAPAALYWHIKNKQELISAIATQILAPVSVSDGETEIRGYCATLWRCLLSHRDGAELVSSALAQPDSPLRAEIEGNLTTLLAGAGHSDETSLTGAQALLHLLLGASVQQQSSQQLASALSDDDASDDPARDTQEDLGAIEQQIEIVLRGLR